MPDNHLETLLLYAAGETSPDETIEFEKHLASCEECRMSLKTMQKAHEWAKMAEEEPAPELFEAVLSANRRYNTKIIFGKRLFRYGAVMTLASALAVVFLMLRPRRQEPALKTGLLTSVGEIEQQVPAPNNKQLLENHASRRIAIRKLRIGTFECSRGFRPFRLPNGIPEHRMERMNIVRIAHFAPVDFPRVRIKRVEFRPIRIVRASRA